MIENNARFILKISLFVIIAGVLSVYFFHQTRAYFLGPKIVIESPEQGGVFEKSLILIKGRVFNTSNVLLNGCPVLSDSFGNFEENLLLARGYNIIEITAEDKFGREEKQKLEVILK
ncbi:MAG: hypothetical protein COT67_01335 [Candidatus Tagabacteria bacterium CG09_land_8_20_14_0_10_41_14]|uniref:IPT/TIG domain-containing protein n=2 Tax=Candidatus Tagaibacteriota TaxID=1817918 RepID=A0A2H0WNM9_9BACT|nr:MAG: hypothetical protein COT67_01335 [Candidatus Tagabacteria bacterium CG09_land_8_20_14_0_10_41_14]PJE73063.1 MAG: hypothetical protein COV00_01830 [Candidatus Tagabacteria bacterium CG10_big_fil_rev_8_21_14_0_10_40_13]